jgi:hypothetical protein
VEGGRREGGGEAVQTKKKKNFLPERSRLVMVVFSSKAVAKAVTPVDPILLPEVWVEKKEGGGEEER